MEEIQRFRILNKLKTIYRFNSVQNRKESTAEHNWSALMLADLFLTKNDYDLDRLKIYELLMYHDIVEIETGDTPLHPKIKNYNKKEKEEQAMHELKEKIPKTLKQKFSDLFTEFEEQKTKEAKFAKAIDALDAQIHEMDYKEDWKGWTKEFLITKKAHLFKEFPEMEKTFNDLVDYLEQNNYFDA